MVGEPMRYSFAQSNVKGCQELPPSIVLLFTLVLTQWCDVHAIDVSNIKALVHISIKIVRYHRKGNAQETLEKLSGSPWVSFWEYHWALSCRVWRLWRARFQS